MSQSTPPTSHYRLPEVDRESAASSSPSASTSKLGHARRADMASTPRHRLTVAGSSIMQEHWDKFPGQMPSVGKRREMLRLITQVPGCDFYKTSNVFSWFKARIEKIEREKMRDSRFPSLSPFALAHLGVLVKNQRNPSFDVVTTWGTLLNVKVDDIVAWLRAQDFPQQEARLPTPATTATPESSASPKPAPQDYSSYYHTDFKQDPSVSPVLTPAIPTSSYYRPRPVSQLSVSTGTSPATSAFPSPMSPLPPVEHNKSWRPHVTVLETAIAQGVRDAVANPPAPPVVLPKSAAEFNTMFAAHEDSLTQLYQALRAS